MLLFVELPFLEQDFMGEPIKHYLWFTTIILLTLALKKPVAALLARISSKFASTFNYTNHRATISELLFKPMERLLQTVLYFVAANQLSGLLNNINIDKHLYIGTKIQVDISLGTVIDHLFLLLFIVFLSKVITRFIDFVYYLRMGKAEAEKNQSQQQLLPLIKEISKLSVWTLSAFAILGFVFHVNVPALITGLGIGGVAIALAGKETVENFFAAFTLLSDKPFLTGDIIKLGDIEGVVERIGFRSTRLRNNDGSAYIIPNQNLVSQNLINLSTRSTRGMKIVANIRYGISHEVLTQLIDELKETLKKMPPIEAPILAMVETFDKETMQLVITYYLPHPIPEGNTLLAIKHEVNLKVFEVISKYAKLGNPPITNIQNS